MQHRYIKTLLVSAAFACLLSVSALAANDGAGTVNASDVNLRSGASLSSDVIKTVDANTPLVVIDSSDSEWYKVWCSGSEGYMSSDYVSFADVLDASFGTGTISGTMVRLRSGASTASDTLAYFDTGDSMTVTGVNGCWYKVTAGSMSGYVHSDYLALANQVLAAPTVTTESAGSTIVSTAKQYLGVPYVWAGTSPGGFDCSGFVYYVYKQNGYTTNRTAASLFSDGAYVDRSQLQPGDVICFYSGSYGYIGHCGIYIGDGQFIHASSSAGQVVIDSLSEGYYNSHYYGARRIV
ncbi:MAG TPA: C40 family peptidase [Firmicutes bacterium]|nr:C40 family peptidase [Bacillota bacterium]